MTEESSERFPPVYSALLDATWATGFTMASDVLTCSLLRTLAASKPKGNFLELGTGTGLSTAWILDGMDKESTLVSVDNDAKFLTIAENFLGSDERLQLICEDGREWISKNRGEKYDYVFADTWHGKYLLVEQVLAMVSAGGFYIIDDMLPQPNWPEGHQQKAIDLIAYLETRDDFVLTKQAWASGILLAVKK